MIPIEERALMFLEFLMRAMLARLLEIFHWERSYVHEGFGNSSPMSLLYDLDDATSLDPVWEDFYADPLSAPLPADLVGMDGESADIFNSVFASAFPTANYLVGADR